MDHQELDDTLDRLEDEQVEEAPRKKELPLMNQLVEAAVRETCRRLMPQLAQLAEESAACRRTERVSFRMSMACGVMMGIAGTIIWFNIIAYWSTHS